MPRHRFLPEYNPLAPYLALAAIWLLTISIVPPRGDFPLNDDWIYAKVVQHLADTGEFQSNPYADPTFIAQAYWGAAFVKLFGFSFDTLRLSTLVLGLVAIWSVCWCAIEAGLSRRWAFFCGLTLLVNPIMLNLSYTFMTDVPFVACFGLAVAAFTRAHRTGRLRWIWYANAFAVCAFFVRQFGVLIPLAFAVAILLQPNRANRTPRAHFTAALLLPWIAAGILLRTLPVAGEGIGAWDWSLLGATWADRGLVVATFGATALLYLALFVAPILAVGLRDQTKSPVPRRFVKRRIPVLIIALVLGWLAFQSPYDRPPKLGNVLYDLGVGALLIPWSLKDRFPDTPARMGPVSWTIITLILLPGAALLLSQLTAIVYRAVRRPFTRGGAENGAELFLALLTAACVIVLILPPVLARFDRYFLMAQVPLGVLLAMLISRRLRFDPSRWDYALPILIYLFSVLALQDYLAWTRARWTALETLRTEFNAPLDEINGGYEFNGWYHSDQFVEQSRERGAKVFGPRGWWIQIGRAHV